MYDKIDVSQSSFNEFPHDILAALVNPKDDNPEPAGHRMSIKEVQAEKLLARLHGLAKMQFLPLSETYTDETQEMRNSYRKMLRDPTVKAAIWTKILAVAQLDPQVNPASDRPIDGDAADFIKHCLKKIKGGLRNLCKAVLLGGLIEGYSICEKVWTVEHRGRWSGKYRLKALKAKDPENLIIETDEFRNIVSIKDRRTNENYHPDNFVIFTNMGMYESPTGTSDLRSVYRAYWLMDTAWKLRAVGLERFGLPMLMGKYTDPTSKIELEAALAQARAQSWITFPEGAMVEAMQLASRGTSDFEAAIRDLKEEIVLGVSGAVLQMLQGQVADGRGSSDVHRGTAELLQWMLAAEMADLINDQITPDLIEFNFEGADYPETTLGGINDGAMSSSLQIDQGLHSLGVALSKKEMYQRYGRQEPEDEKDKLAQNQNGFGMMPGMAPQGGGFGGSGGMPFAEGDGPVPPGGPRPPGPGGGQPALTPQQRSKGIADLQRAYVSGELPREAAMANAKLAFQVTDEQAEGLFPLAPGAKDDTRAERQARNMDEELTPGAKRHNKLMQAFPQHDNMGEEDIAGEMEGAMREFGEDAGGLFDEFAWEAFKTSRGTMGARDTEDPKKRLYGKAAQKVLKPAQERHEKVAPKSKQAMRVEPPHTFSPARYAKGKVLFKQEPDGSGIKTRGHRLAIALGGRYTHRERGYILSPTQAEKLKQALADGSDAGFWIHGLRRPEIEKPEPAKPIYERAATEPITDAEITEHMQSLGKLVRPQLSTLAKSYDVTPGAKDTKASILQKIKDSIERRRDRKERTNYGSEGVGIAEAKGGPAAKTLASLLDADYDTIKSGVASMANMTVPQIHAAAKEAGITLAKQPSKAALLQHLENWLTDVRYSKHQGSVRGVLHASKPQPGAKHAEPDAATLVPASPDQAIEPKPSPIPAWVPKMALYLQPDSQTCGPAVTKMVCEHFGKPEQVLSHYAESLGTTADGGTPPANIVNYLQSQGFDVVGDTMELDDLWAWSRAGVPVICPIQVRDESTGGDVGHYVIVRGMDDAFVYMNDPSHGEVAMPVLEFLRRWHDRDAAGNAYLRYGIAVQQPVVEQVVVEAK